MFHFIIWKIQIVNGLILWKFLYQNWFDNFLKVITYNVFEFLIP